MRIQTCSAENRATAFGTTLTASYGSDGLRASTTSGSTTTYYLYDNDSTIPVCELNASGTITATNTVGIDGLISRNTSSGSTFYVFDQQGSVAERLNSDGAVTSTSLTDAFGAVVNSATVTDPFGYEAQQGYYTDQSTGLILTTFRYYDPSAGRFLNRDPISYAGGMNVYGYCGNGAESATDPHGLWPLQLAGAGGALFGTGLTLEGLGIGADATVLGVPAGAALGIAGGVVMTGGILIFVGQAAYNWLSQAAPGPVVSTPTVHDLNDVHNLGNQPDPSDTGGKLTKIGRSLEKHGGRTGSVYPKATGNAADKNEQGADVLGDILSNPDLEKIERGSVTDYKIPNGCGVRINNDDNTIKGLLNP